MGVKPRLVWCMATITTIGLAAWFWSLYLAPLADPISQFNCDRIKPGMTRAEVEAILGRPADLTVGYTNPEGAIERLGGTWLGERGSILLVYEKGDSDTVHSVSFARREVPGLIERLKVWLGL